MKNLKSIFVLVLVALVSLTMQAGTVSGYVAAPNGVKIKGGTLTWTLSQVAYQSGVSVVASTPANCYTDSVSGSIVGLADPASISISGAIISGDTMPAGTYYVKYAWVDASGGTTNPSPAAVVTLSAAGRVVVNVTPPTRAVAARIYIGTSANAVTLQATYSGFTTGTPYTLIFNTPLVTGTAPSSSNTSLCTLVFNDELIPSYTSYRLTVMTSGGTLVSGFPQSYYLYGGVVDLTTLIPAGNLKVVWPSAIVANPVNGQTQSISGPLSLGGYALTAGSITAQTLSVAAAPSLNGFTSTSSAPPAVRLTGVVDAAFPPVFTVYASPFANPGNYVRTGYLASNFAGGVKSGFGLFGDGVPVEIGNPGIKVETTGKVNIESGMLNSAAGFKHIRVTTCTTAATANSFCDTTVTFASAFADASYTLACSADNSLTGFAQFYNFYNVTAAGFTLRVYTTTNSAAQSVANCIAVHD